MINNISVILPTYNTFSFLDNAIRSILSQTFTNFELLIIDDGSYDDTQVLVSNFDDNRIIYHKRKHFGLTDSLNFGLENATYDWVARMDADDIALPNRLATQIEFLNQNPQYSVVSCSYAVFKEKRITQVVSLPVNHNDIVNNFKLHSTICHPGTIFLKKVIIDSGGYHNIPFEDYELWLRVKDKIMFFNIPKILMLVNGRKNSLHRNLNMDTSAILLMQRKYFPAGTSNPISKSQQKENSQIEGWREWFYGNKKESRKYWMKNYSIFKDLKIFLAFILSFLPSKLFKFIKQLNIKARIHYLRLSKENKKELNSFISSQSYK